MIRRSLALTTFRPSSFSNFSSSLLLTVVLLALAAFGLPGYQRSQARPVFTTITVNTTLDSAADDGLCSLREAIQAANSNSPVDECTGGGEGTDIIQFNLGTGTPTINLQNPLPVITNPVFINGATGGATRVELNGAGAGAGAKGLVINTGNTSLKNLVINRFSSHGVEIQSSSSNNSIENCLIGTNAAGTAAQGNGGHGVYLLTGGNQVGQGTAATRNIISGNGGFGVLLFSATAAGNLVKGNYIGTNSSGTSALGNTLGGVSLQSGANNNTIGGQLEGAGNVISGNSGNGVYLDGAATSGNAILGNLVGTNAAGAAALPNAFAGVSVANGAQNNSVGSSTFGEGNLLSGNTGAGLTFTGATTNNNVARGNYIGTDIDGTAALPNGTNGISIQDAHDNTIGGTDAAVRNIISGNTQRGILVFGTTATNNLIQGNFIGTDAEGTAALPNQTRGIEISNSPGNTIGGTTPGAGNRIAFNTLAGVVIGTPTALNNRVLGNQIFGNGELGLDLGNNGSTANDTNDPDTGANNVQNSPVLNFVTSTGFLGGSIDSALANSAYPLRLEFFANAACDSSGQGEGQFLLTTLTVTGPGFFTQTYMPEPGKPFITVTATDANGNTSEFSACRQEGNAPAQTITVNTTADTVAADGFCSLREALQAANTNLQVNECNAGVTGLDNIVFNVGTGTPTINVTSALPTITEAISINGATGGATRIELNGVEAGATSGLTVNDIGCTLMNLVINRFMQHGIDIQGSDTTVQGCLIGTNAAGTAALGNGQSGINATAGNNTIGGNTVSARNVISGNALYGIDIIAVGGNFIQGNYIGLNAAGTAALPNGDSGIRLEGAPTNTIGGSSAGEGNVISGNGNRGIESNGSGAFGNVIQGNIVGLNAAGTAALPNTNSGIRINNSPNNLIGGTSFTARNVISGNTNNGVHILGADSNGNEVFGNFIGLNAEGSAGIGNGQEGVQLDTGAQSNSIGGIPDGQGNFIAFNDRGVVVLSSAAIGNRILRNSFYSNVRHAIDLNQDGITANDGNDADTGPNELQNFPVLTSAQTVNGIITIQGTLNSAPNSDFRIEFFASLGCDASGNGEGQFYVGSTFVTTNASGNVSFSHTHPLPRINGLVAITATATDSGDNTSEFSACLTNCFYSIAPTSTAFQETGGTGNVALTATTGCAWTAMSNAPWLHLTSASSGVGNATVTYTVDANPLTTPRTGTLTIAGNTFTVTQAAAGLPVTSDFDNGIPTDWTVVDGGVGTYPNSTPATWTTANPCSRVIPPPFQNGFAIMDSACASPDVTLDEQLITAPFDATGLGQVILQFDNQFHWFPGGLNEVGDVDVTTNDGQTWTNVLRLQGGEDGFPTPNTKTINLTPFISGNPANVRVRFRYYTTAAPLRPDAPAGFPAYQPGKTPGQIPNIPTTQELWWGLDRPTILAFTISPTSQALLLPGGAGTINVTAGAGVTWTAQSNVPWLGVNVTSGTGSGAVNYTAQPNQTGTPRTGTLTVAGNTFTVMQSNTCPTVTISPANTALPPGVTNTSYSQTFTQTGLTGTPTWSSAGSLPTGLTLNPSSGVLSGTLTAAGSFNFTVRANDSTGCFGERAYSLSVTCPTIVVSPVNASLPPGTAGTPYNQSFTQSGGNGAISFTVSAGSLPTGLNLATNGSLSGTPTVFGTFNFTVRATDANGCFGERAYSLALSAPCGTVTVNPASLANGFVGANYSQTLSGAGGTAPYTFSVTAGSLPPGLNLNPTTGLLNGTPTTVGAFTFTVTATDANNCPGARSFTVIVSGNGLQYFPLAKPIRLFDTRATIPGFPACAFLNQPIAADSELIRPARLTCDGVTIPASAAAIVGNATVTGTSGFGFLTLYPNGQARPAVANLNYGPGETVQNAFTVGLDAAGQFKAYSFAGTHLIVDVTGYFAPPAAGGLYYHPLPKPIRLFDTRATIPGFPACEFLNQAIAADSEIIRGARLSCDGVTIPNDALALEGNATVTSTTGVGFLTLYPNGQARPPVANLNFAAGQTNQNAFTVGLDAAGQFKVYAFAGTHLIVDVTGYYSAAVTDVNGTGLLYSPLSKPLRLFDTRATIPGFPACEFLNQPLVADSELVRTAPTTCDGVTIPTNAAALVGIGTVTGPSGFGFLTLFPNGQTRPPVSTLNYASGQTLSNAFTVGLNGAGQFRIYSFAGTHFITDVTGYYAP